MLYQELAEQGQITPLSRFVEIEPSASKDPRFQVHLKFIDFIHKACYCFSNTDFEINIDKF